MCRKDSTRIHVKYEADTNQRSEKCDRRHISPQSDRCKASAIECVVRNCSAEYCSTREEEPEIDLRQTLVSSDSIKENAERNHKVESGTKYKYDKRSYCGANDCHDGRLTKPGNRRAGRC